MKKALKIVGGVIVGLLILVAYFYYGVSHMPFPWKVTDPHDPRFVAEDFRFEDYYGREGSKKLQEALRVMFPIGTPKEKVDKILYENQPKYTDSTKWGALSKASLSDPRKPQEKNIHIYSYVPYPYALNIFLVCVFFDENNLVKELDEIRGGPLYNKNFFEEK